jgi:hypothetical protein
MKYKVFPFKILFFFLYPNRKTGLKTFFTGISAATAGCMPAHAL